MSNATLDPSLCKYGYSTCPVCGFGVGHTRALRFNRHTRYIKYDKKSVYSHRCQCTGGNTTPDTLNIFTEHNIRCMKREGVDYEKILVNRQKKRARIAFEARMAEIDRRKQAKRKGGK